MKIGIYNGFAVTFSKYIKYLHDPGYNLDNNNNKQLSMDWQVHNIKGYKHWSKVFSFFFFLM